MIGDVVMDRKVLVDREIRRRAKKSSKFNSAFISNVNSSSKFSSEYNRCIYSKVICQKVDRDGFRPCIFSKNEDGSSPRFCRNVPVEARASLASSFQEAIKSGDFNDEI